MESPDATPPVQVLPWLRVWGSPGRLPCAEPVPQATVGQGALCLVQHSGLGHPWAVLKEPKVHESLG